MQKMVTIEFPVANEADAQRVYQHAHDAIVDLINPEWIHVNIRKPNDDEQAMLDVFADIDK